MKKKGKSIVICMTLAALMIPLMIGASYANQGTGTDIKVKEWRIPYLIFMTGPLAGIASMHKWVTDQIVDEVNASGGIAGRPIVIDYMDTGTDPTKAAAAMAKAIDSGALCVIGPMMDRECKGAMPLAVREGIYAFSGTGTEPARERFKPWLLNATAPKEEDKKYTMPLWIKHEPEIKSVVAIIQPVYPYIAGVWKHSKAKLEEMNIKTYSKIEVPAGMLDYSPIAVRALGTGANGFWIGCTEDVAAKVVKELVDRGVKQNHIWLFTSSVGATFIDQTKGYNEGLYSGQSPKFAENQKFIELNERYMETHGGATLAPLAHTQAEMVFLIKEAIETQGITGDPDKLKEERIKIRDYANNRKDFQGLRHKYDIVDGQGRCFPRYLFQIRNGKLELVDRAVPTY